MINLSVSSEKGFAGASEIKPDAVVVERDEYGLIVRGAGAIWVKGTRRAFVDNLDIGIDTPDDPEGTVTAAIPVRQAWTFSEDDWKQISEDFHIDVRLYHSSAEYPRL